MIKLIVANHIAACSFVLIEDKHKIVLIIIAISKKCSEKASYDFYNNCEIYKNNEITAKATEAGVVSCNSV
jgi:hypothetical protein